VPVSTFRLQVNEPGAKPRVLVVGRPTEIGRDCEGIVLDDATASRRHAEVVPTEHGLVLRDLGSSNGTLAGGQPVTEPMVLVPGAWFEIGETRLVVHESRPGDTHRTDTDLPDDGSPDEGDTGADSASGRASGGRRVLNQATSRTDRPGGSVRRPPRP
jgi:pSer/pThr/pTyr-binding forkhead associated (FHA) protein